MSNIAENSSDEEDFSFGTPPKRPLFYDMPVTSTFRRHTLGHPNYDRTTSVIEVSSSSEDVDNESFEVEEESILEVDSSLSQETSEEEYPMNNKEAELSFIGQIEKLRCAPSEEGVTSNYFTSEDHSSVDKAEDSSFEKNDHEIRKIEESHSFSEGSEEEGSLNNEPQLSLVGQAKKMFCAPSEEGVTSNYFTSEDHSSVVNAQDSSFKKNDHEIRKIEESHSFNEGSEEGSLNNEPQLSLVGQAKKMFCAPSEEGVTSNYFTSEEHSSMDKAQDSFFEKNDHETSKIKESDSFNEGLEKKGSVNNEPPSEDGLTSNYFTSKEYSSIGDKNRLKVQMNHSPDLASFLTANDKSFGNSSRCSSNLAIENISLKTSQFKDSIASLEQINRRPIDLLDNFHVTLVDVTASPKQRFSKASFFKEPLIEETRKNIELDDSYETDDSLNNSLTTSDDGFEESSHPSSVPHNNSISDDSSDNFNCTFDEINALLATANSPCQVQKTPQKSSFEQNTFKTPTPVKSFLKTPTSFKYPNKIPVILTPKTFVKTQVKKSPFSAPTKNNIPVYSQLQSKTGKSPLPLTPRSLKIENHYAKSIVSPLSTYINHPTLNVRSNVTSNTISKIPRGNSFIPKINVPSKASAFPKVVYRPARIEHTTRVGKDTALPNCIKKLVKETPNITQHKERLGKSPGSNFVERKLEEADLTLMDITQNSVDVSIREQKRALPVLKR